VLNRNADVHGNLNMKSAYMHVLSDALGSVGAIVAGLLILLFDWTLADPIISVVVALLILRSAWGILRTSLHILMEGTPHTIDAQEVKERLLEIEGVLDVHDLHIWTITSGLDLFTCHINVSANTDEQRVLQESLQLIHDYCGIDHATIQIEKSRTSHPSLQV